MTRDTLNKRMARKREDDQRRRDKNREVVDFIVMTICFSLLLSAFFAMMLLQI